MFLKYFNYCYLLLLPGLLLAVFFAILNKLTYSRYFRTDSMNKVTGSYCAEKILHKADLKIPIEKSGGASGGKSKDLYSAKDKCVYLSEPVFSTYTVAAVGVGSHEAGHAVSHHKNKILGNLNIIFQPILDIAKLFVLPCFILSLIFLLYANTEFLRLSARIAVSSFAVLFFLCTVINVIILPAELKANKWAYSFLNDLNLINKPEGGTVKKVLRADSLENFENLIFPILFLIRITAIVIRRIRK